MSERGESVESVPQEFLLPRSPLDIASEAGTKFDLNLATLEFKWLKDILNTADTGWGIRGHPRFYEEVLQYRLRKHLGVVQAFIDPSVLALGHIPFPIFNEGGEGDKHHFAKRLAALWIVSLGGSPEEEARRYGGRVDVFCKNTGIAVECGSLSADRLMDMLMDEAVKRAVVLPFSEPLALCFEGKPCQVPFLEFAFLEGWEATRQWWEDMEFERSRKACEALEFD